MPKVRSDTFSLSCLLKLNLGSMGIMNCERTRLVVGKSRRTAFQGSEREMLVAQTGVERG